MITSQDTEIIKSVSLSKIKGKKYPFSQTQAMGTYVANRFVITAPGIHKLILNGTK